MRKIHLIFVILSVACFIVILPGETISILGGDGDEGELIAPRQMEEGPDGNIYVYDFRIAAIKCYSPDGRFIRQIGRKGEGPGEIKRADGLRFGFIDSQKILYFSEFFGGHPWITMMNLDGSLNKTVKIKLNMPFGILRLRYLNRGEFLSEIHYTPSFKGIGDYFLFKFPITLVRINPSGNIVKEIIRREHFSRISFLRGGADIGLPFVPKFYWAVIGETIYFTDGTSRQIIRYTLDGQPIRPISTPLPEPVKVTRNHLKEWKKQQEKNFSATNQLKAWYNEFGKVIEKYNHSIHKQKPNTGGFSATPSGNLLIKGPVRKDGNSIYWLTDSSGKSLASINSSLIKIKMSAGFLLVTFHDDEDNTIVGFMKRKGTEIQDFLRLDQLSASKYDPG